MPASKDSVARLTRSPTLEGVPLPAAHPAPATCFCPPPSPHPPIPYPIGQPGHRDWVSVPEPKTQSLSSAPGPGAPFPTSTTQRLGHVLRPKKCPARSVLLNPSTGTRGSTSTSTYGPHSPLTEDACGVGHGPGAPAVSGPVWPRAARAGTGGAGLRPSGLYSPPAPRAPRLRLLLRGAARAPAALAHPPHPPPREPPGPRPLPRCPAPRSQPRPPARPRPGRAPRTSPGPRRESPDRPLPPPHAPRNRNRRRRAP